MLNRCHFLWLAIVAALLVSPAAAQDAPEVLPAAEPRSSLDYSWDAYLRGELERRNAFHAQWELNDMMRHWSAFHPGGVSFWYSPRSFSYGWSWSHPYGGSYSVTLPRPGMRAVVRRPVLRPARRRTEVLPPPVAGREF